MGFYHYKLSVFPPDCDRPGDEPLKDVPLDSSFLSELRSLLPQNKSWGPVEEFESSAEWGSDLRIWHVEDLTNPLRADIESIDFRFSPLGDPVEVLETFINLVSQQNFGLFSCETRQHLAPELAIVLDDFKQTVAFEALSDPEAALLKAAEQASKKDGREKP